MKKSAIIVNLLFIINALTQLVSQIVISRTFGAKLDLDIFLAAVALPTLIVSSIYSTLNDAFLPLYGEKKIKDQKNADQYYISNLIFLTFIFIFIGSLMMLVSPTISTLLYKSRGEIFIKNVSLQMSYMFISMPLAIISTLFGAYFYSHKSFSRFPLAQALGNLSNLLMIIFLAPFIGIWALIFSFVVNIVFQILIVIPFKLIRQFNFSKLFIPRSFLDLRSLGEGGSEVGEIGNLLKAWLPLIVGYSVFRSESVLIRSLASNLPTGYLVYLNLITKISTLATGVMTIGIQIVVFPHLVEYLNNKTSYLKAFNLINKAKFYSIILSIFVVVLIIFISPTFIKLLFVGGKFTLIDAEKTIKLIPYFILPAIGWGIYAVFFQPLLALKKQFILAILCVFSLVIALISAFIIKIIFGSLMSAIGGITILLFTGIIGSEILWQYYKKSLKKII